MTPPPNAAASPRTAATFGLPPTGAPRLRALLGRALARRCPYCGGGGIFKGWFGLRDRCPTCGVSYDREEGYFLGAYAVNLIVAEILALAIALGLIFGTGLRRADLLWQEAIAIGLAVALPLLFFPFSRTIWIALDLMLDPPTAIPERRLRGHEMGSAGRAGEARATEPKR
jgi:uncharacterized protein (DUF983 family)